MFVIFFFLFALEFDVVFDSVAVVHELFITFFNILFISSILIVKIKFTIGKAPFNPYERRIRALDSVVSISVLSQGLSGSWPSCSQEKY